MTFEDFWLKFSSKGCVSTRFLAESDASFDKNSLTRWCRNGYLVKLRNGWYAFSDFFDYPDSQFVVACRIYPDSYVSLHSALIHHGFVSNQLQSQLSCVSLHKTMEFRNAFGNFDYHAIHKNCFFGFETVGKTDFTFQMATPEKALLDLFYLFPTYYDTEKALRNFALEEKKMYESWDSERMYAYLSVFENVALEKRVALFARMYGF